MRQENATQPDPSSTPDEILPTRAGAEGPLVSVVVCAHNAGAYLRDAVASALDQSYPNLEVLVIDDGSDDDSFASLAAFDDARLCILRHENRGKAASLNRALDEMNGEFYAILDADDRCQPERVARQAQAMQDDSELAAVFCGVELISEDRTLAPRFKAKSVDACRADLAALRMPGHDPSAMFRTSLARQVRYRDDRQPRDAAGEIIPGSDPLRIGYDGYDFILRLGELAPRMRVLGECLYQYRVHLASITRAQPEARLRAVYEIQRDACERRGRPAPAAPHFGGPVRNRDRDNNLAAHFMESAVDLRRAGRFAEALSAGLACARLQPLDAYYYRALLYAVLPSAWIARLRGRGEATAA